ncbi:hypothetical protein [Kribbella sp.]|uniref:hypothetical protein n=1 Tax=Kribbella sp. TaxID=1871183 RepID=UPI002D3C6F48|nr:hypothetical protein [Kribbella sp.]HZX01676.1 hypothetical protein [Kribbella sp.]
MTYFIAGNTAVGNARSLTQSALPNAPQQPYDAPRPTLRTRLATALRATAAREVRLANRIDPTPTCQPTTAH